MTVKCSWGEKLTATEVDERERRFNQRAEALKAMVQGRLGDMCNGHMVVKRAACIDCPEYPSECRLCQQDASMASLLEKPALRLIVGEEAMAQLYCAMWPWEDGHRPKCKHLLLAGFCTATEREQCLTLKQILERARERSEG